MIFFLFFFNDTATTEIYTLSLHDALPIYLRLSGSNQIQVWDTAANINANFDEQTQKLKEEGWVRTDSNLINAIQKGSDKVHLTMIQSRIHSDGSEYNRFQTLWIFIRENERWGVKFRSSFLVNATENTNFGTLS